MTTGTLPRTLAQSTFALSDGFGFQPTFFTKDNGALAYQHVAVFRTGTFRDSRGVQNTWEKMHLDQIVQNWNYLRNNKIFDDVPVRHGHPHWLLGTMPGAGEPVGWHTNLSVETATSPADGQEYNYLFADYDITDPRAQEKIQSGTWRNRSAEIGMYLDNREAEFWPVYMGVAYVDIPAVEGLKFSSGDDRTRLFVFLNGFSFDRETGVTTTAQGAPAAAPPATTVTPPAAPSALPFAARSAEPQSFSINGAATTDPVAVQQHILALENFQREVTAGARAEFVNNLAATSRIAATQLEGMLAFVAGLSPEQYDLFRKGYDGAPAVQALGNHGGGVTNPAGTATTAPSTPVDAAAADIQLAKDTVAQHKRSGLTPTQIKATASYKKLEAAGQAPAL